MSRSLGPHLPDALLSRLATPDPAGRFGPVVVLTTVDPYGWPHPALLSYAELLAFDATCLRLGLHPGTRSALQLRDSGRATLVFTDAERALYVKVESLPLPEAPRAARLWRFELRVREVLEDRAAGEEAGARLAAGLRFRWPQGREAWARHATRMRHALEA